MYTVIQQLEKDHEEILAFLKIFEEQLIQFMEDDVFELTTYTEAISYIREFADHTHHQREEDGLFQYMIEYGGVAAEKLIRHGMLVEHDQARFNVSQLEKAVHNYAKEALSIQKLWILSYGASYCELLRRHIEKENNTVYPFAQRCLPKHILEQLDLPDKKVTIH